MTPFEKALYEALVAILRGDQRRRFWVLPHTKRRLEAQRRLGADITIHSWFSEHNTTWLLLRIVAAPLALAAGFVWLFVFLLAHLHP